jgi:hypothetical protein
MEYEKAIAAISSNQHWRIVPCLHNAVSEVSTIFLLYLELLLVPLKTEKSNASGQ